VTDRLSYIADHDRDRDHRGRRQRRPPRGAGYPTTYDAELLVSDRTQSGLRHRRFLVDSEDPALRRILRVLTAARPEASRLDVEPAETYRETGAADPARTVKIVLAIVIGIPLLISLVMIVLAATGNAS
jgi:hypothetical protein